MLHEKINYNNLREISEIIAKNAVFDQLSNEMKEEMLMQGKLDMTQLLNELVPQP